ncbi:hypothetical protein [Thiomicrorhabdus immobilis]|uniref:hypothetical protein n=1 Tax=Thiomicrorhabdus immobilis TaxID=2791037 RepID=UPI001F2C4BD8|nr:hypothetical protein [Thiomicrorhabdus immobilis]
MTKRKIFYIPGFDPRSESYYKKLLLQNFPEIKASLSGQTKSQLSYQLGGLSVDYEILSWHESVRNHWLSGFKGNLINVATLFTEFVFKGGYLRGSKVTLRDAIQKGFSVYLFLAWFLLAVGLLFYIKQSIYDVYGGFATVLAMIAWFFLNALIYRGFEKTHIFWVTRIMRFFALYAKQQTVDVIEKEKQFQAKIAYTLQSKAFDEVVLVGHSVGTILTLNILSELEKNGQAKALSVFTLGHCVTGVSVVKGAAWFNQKLASIEYRQSYWVDVTSGKDAVNFYKVNPGFDTKAKPDRVLSAGFHKIFYKKFYKSLRWDFYKVHFLYLYKPDLPDKSVFNYQKLLTEPLLLKRLKEGAE